MTTNARRALTSILFIIGSDLFWLSGFILHDSVTTYTAKPLPMGEFLVPVILFVAGLVPAVIIFRSLIPFLSENPGRRTIILLRVLFLIGFTIVFISSFLYPGH